MEKFTGDFEEYTCEKPSHLGIELIKKSEITATLEKDFWIDFNFYTIQYTCCKTTSDNNHK